MRQGYCRAAIRSLRSMPDRATLLLILFCLCLQPASGQEASNRFLGGCSVNLKSVHTQDDSTKRIGQVAPNRYAPFALGGRKNVAVTATDATIAPIDLHPEDDIATIVAAAPDGTIFILHPGTYQNVTIRPKDGQSFIGMDGAVLDGSVEVDGWIKSGDLWTASGYPAPAWSHGEGRDGMAQFTEDLVVGSKPLVRVATLAEVSEESFFYCDGMVYTRADPTGVQTTVLKTAAAFDGGKASGVTIENLTIRGYASPAQHGAINAHDTSGWILRNLTVTGNHGAGVAAGDGMQILGGSYSLNGQVGIHAYETTGLTIDGVVAAENNYAGFSQTWDAGGIKILTSDKVIVRNSEIGENHGMGLWFDWDNKDVSILNNNIYSNEYIGLFYEASYNALISGNRVEDNNRNGYVTGYWGADILAISSWGVTIEDNYVRSTAGQGIGMEQSPREPGRYGGHEMGNSTVTGNLIVMAEGGGNGVSGLGDAITWNMNNYIASSADALWFTWQNKHIGGGYLASHTIDSASNFMFVEDPAALALMEQKSDQATSYSMMTGETLQGTLVQVPVIATIVLTGSANGSLSLSETGDFDYVPRAGFSGHDSFEYLAVTEDGSILTGIANIDVKTASVLTVRVAGDAWDGNPMFNLYVDGTLVANDVAVTADYGAGEWQDIAISGDFDIDSTRLVTLEFVNDGYGGIEKDRNLYIDSLTLDGMVHDAATGSSTAGWSMAHIAPMVVNGSITIDTSRAPDELVLKVAGDHFNGAPRFDLSVNGRMMHNFEADTVRDDGIWQDIVLRGNFGETDDARVEVLFHNDNYQDIDMDRNLAVQSITLNGRNMEVTNIGTWQDIGSDGYLGVINGSIVFEL